MSTQLDYRPVTEEVLDTDEPILSHIVPGTKDKSSQAIVMEARVMGTPVTALCGYTWVPSRNPEHHPVCQKCVKFLELDSQLPKM